jgi:putative transposase
MIASPPLLPQRYYHVYNRGNNREDIFREERNYQYFLDRYAGHIDPVAETFAYCLLRNHFHLLIRIRPEAEWPDATQPVRRFANLFSSYAKAYNRSYGRSGCLFAKPFRRVEVSDVAYFARLVCYIHQNPQRHGFLSDFREYPHSSYWLVLDSRPTRLQRRQTLEWFGGADGFVAGHLVDVDLPAQSVGK